MYEPKYKLNKRDEKRWHDLAVKEALSRISPEEIRELQALTRKKRARINRHPKVKASIRASYRHARKTRQLLAQLEAALKKHEAQDRLLQ